MKRTINSQRKTKIGTVISDKMTKTVTVQWETKKMHPLYKKFVVRHKKIKARDEKSEAKTGDVVKVVETRPLSKEVNWKVVEIVKKAHKGDK